MTSAVTRTAASTPETAARHGLEALLRPRGVAVVGASADPSKLGSALARSVARSAVPYALVNPRADRPDGYDADLAQAAQRVELDLALLAVPAAACPAVLAEAARAGARAAVVYAGGFAETGERGAALQRELAQVCADTGIRLLGPNTSGLFVPPARVLAGFVPGIESLPAGGVAVVAASGGMNHALCFAVADAGCGLSLGVGLGGCVDVAAADVLEHLTHDGGTDDATTAVALHVETVDDGPRLVAAVRALTATRPVAALVVGRHDVSAFAASHTGALASSYRVTRAALRAAGAVLVDDEQQLVSAVTTLSRARLPRRTRHRAGRVGVVTAQAGPGLVLLDQLLEGGATVPPLSTSTRQQLASLLPPLTFQVNPVDTGRPGPSFASVVSAVVNDPSVDVVALYALAEAGVLDQAAAIPAPVPGRPPVVVGLGGRRSDTAFSAHALHAKSVPTLAGPTALAVAVRALLDDAAPRAEQHGAPPVADHGGPDWDEAAAKDLLDALGVPTPARRTCAVDDERAARTALHELAGPVAVKQLRPVLAHKSEAGGVHLAVTDDAGLAEALAALRSVGAEHVLVEQMAPGGIDLVLGVRRDPVFGPVVLLGLGGTAAEALDDVAVAPAPLSPDDASRLPDALAARTALNGWRGGPGLDAGELGVVMSAVAGWLCARPDLAEIEINPLRVTPAGLVALDAVVTRGARG